tara:strand:+ start:293 stop:1501 length:1209 start_codon:yes stop_codon:yes gene_type:complete
MYSYLNQNKLFITRLTIVLLFITVFLFSLFPLFLKEFHFPEVFPFLDLKGRLAHIQANRLGIDTYSFRNPFDPLGRVNDKPSISLIFSFTGLGVKDAIWLGYILISLFIFQAISLLRKTNILFLILGSLCIFNPNTLLAIERGNDDIIIFLFCFGLPYLISKKNHFFNATAIFLVWFLSALKYYPITLYLMFVSKKISKFKIYSFSIILINICWLSLSLKEISFLKRRLPNADAYLFSFSLKELFKFGDSSYLILLLLFFISVLIGYLYLKSDKKVLSEHFLKVSNFDKKYFIIGCTLLTFCYLISFNWSYRLIHSLFLLPLILNLLSETNLVSFNFRYEKFLFIILISLLISNWASFLPIDSALKLKIIFNFIFFSTSSAFGLYVFEDLYNGQKITNFSTI